MKLPVIPQDKANHFIYGAVIGLVALILVSAFRFQYPWAAAVGSAVAVGWAKERYDAYQNKKAEKAFLPPPHESSVQDLYWTAGGGILSAVASLF